MSRSRERRGASRRARYRVLSGALLAATLTGCSAPSPAPVIEPYPPSDGVQVDLENTADGSAVKLRNFLIVAPDGGGRGLVVGSVVNTGASQVQLQLASAAGSATGAPVQVDVPAAGVARVGPEGTSLVLEQVPAPGRFLAMTASTSGGGTESFDVPVVAPAGEYALLTPPAATPSPTASS